MRTPRLLPSLSCLLVLGFSPSAAQSPQVRRVDLRLENAPLSAIVQALNSGSCAAVSFIAATPEGKASVEAHGASVMEVLSDIARRCPGYRAETVAGRSVLYPISPEFQIVLAGIEIQSKPRQEALEEYVNLLRKRVPALAELTPQALIGDDRHPIYSASVSLRPKGRVIEHLIDLLGQDQALYFEFIRAYTGVPMVRFSRVHCAAGMN
jgi:hypothetical protein